MGKGTLERVQQDTGTMKEGWQNGWGCFNFGGGAESKREGKKDR